MKKWCCSAAMALLSGCTFPMDVPEGPAERALALGADCEPGAALRVASFNIRYDAGGFGSYFERNGWLRLGNPRRDRAFSVIRELAADLVGFQELLPNQVDDLTRAFPAYGFVGVGRDDGRRSGEFAGILYSRERFELLRDGHFWLSDTPEQPGTTFPGAATNRMASWVHLHDRRTGRDVLLLNTHWDHVSASARQASARLVQRRLSELVVANPSLADAVLVTGDLNATPSDTPLRELTEGGASVQLTDGYRSVHPVPLADEATSHEWTGRTRGERIDYVLHTSAFVTTESSIVRQKPRNAWPSDHYPVVSVVRYARDGAGNSCR
jgi:endonuclease/exonuclease/phosphatase family metal-dependent hydrolase